MYHTYRLHGALSPWAYQGFLTLEAFMVDFEINQSPCALNQSLALDCVQALNISSSLNHDHIEALNITLNQSLALDGMQTLNISSCASNHDHLGMLNLSGPEALSLDCLETLEP